MPVILYQKKIAMAHTQFIAPEKSLSYCNVR